MLHHRAAYRLANSSDESCIYNALRGLERYAEAYEWAGRVSFDKAFSTVQKVVAAKQAYVVSGFLVLVDVTTTWYSEDKLLQEWLVIKLYDGGSIDDVPKALADIAKELGCVTVMSADSSPVNIVGRAYEKAGYIPLTRLFYRKVDNGNDT